MRKIHYSLTLALIVLLVSVLGVTALAADTACEGCTLGTFNGSPACLSGESLHICENNFPDTNFRSYITSSFDTDGNALLTAEEVTAVTEILCPSMDISSLDGVEFFTALQGLYCFDNALTVLDVSSNTQLETLSVGAEGDIVGTFYTNQLTSLDVSNNPKLSRLSCDENPIKTLDVSNNPLLTSLGCSGCELTELDVSNNTALTNLRCSNNQLTSLDISNRIDLFELNCEGNNLASLDVGNCPELEILYCNSNELTELDLSGNPALTLLSAGDNPLISVDVSNCPELEKLYCYYSMLPTLDTSNNRKLITLSCHGSQLNALDVSNNTALTLLSCGGNQLSALDVSCNTALTSLSCGNNQLSALDVSNNTALTELDCSINQLTELDIRGCSKLMYLYCDGNQLTSLDLSNNPELLELVVGYDYFDPQTGNQLTELDVSKNTALKYLSCSNNALTALTLGDNPNLSNIQCDDNQLTSLDLSGCPNLRYFKCQNNQLTSLDITNNPVINTLDCSNNKLTTLDLSTQHRLVNMSCSNNHLATLVFGYGCDKLVCNGQTLLQAGNVIKTAGGYTVDMAQFVGSGNIANIQTVDNAEYNAASGIATFAARPESITYHISARNSDGSWVSSTVMDVSAPIGCSHSWKDATCTAPKTCKTCGSTESKALGHTWQDATCTTPKTCKICGVTEGDALDHSWQDATCTAPKTCKACGKKDGGALGHNWKGATCTEPKTCMHCKQTAGKPLNHKAGIWTVDKAPTTKEKGSRHRGCTLCSQELEREDLEMLEQGKVENYTDAEVNDHAGQLDNSTEELADKLLTKQEQEQVEQGELIVITLTVEDTTETVTEEEKVLVESVVEEELDDHTVGVYLDVSIYKQVGEQEPEKVTETNSAVTITIAVPEAQRNTDSSIKRTYRVLRIHEGVATILDAHFDEETGLLSFETDAFSTYALIYTDEPVAVADPSNPATGDSSVLFPWLILAFLSGCAMIALPRKKA